MEAVTNIRLVDGPTMLRLKNARHSGWIYIDVRNQDISSYIREAQDFLQAHFKLPSNYSLTWAGQYESMQRVNQRIFMIVLLTILSIFLLLYAIFCQWVEPVLIMVTLPFAVDVRFITLSGIAAEFGVVLLIYLNMDIKQHEEKAQLKSVEDLKQAIIEGAVMRV